MESIGVRELRRDASRWLARVRGGESFVVTDRGRPIAALTPLVETSGYRTLLASGGIAPGSGREIDDVLADLDRDIPPDGGDSVTAALEALRADER